MIKFAMFDMDGLLIDSEPLWQEAEKKVFQKVDIHLTTEMCQETTGTRIDEMVAYWYQRFPWQGPSQEDVALEVLNEVSHLIHQKGESLKGVNGLLETFSSAGVEMAVVSSSPKMLIEAVTEKLEIRSYFKSYFSAEDEKYGKPHPAVYMRALDEQGFATNESIVFEDSLTGILAAKAAKLKVIAIPEEAKFKDERFSIADAKFASLEDVNLEEIKNLIN